MARTAEGAALSEAHRLLQGRIASATTRDLLRLWALVEPANLRTAFDPFTRAALAAILGGRARSSVAATRYYAAFRQTEGVKGTIVVTAAPAPDAGIVTDVVRGATLSGVMNARRRGLSVDEAHRNGFVKLAGSATRMVLGGGRATIMDAIHSDPAATGWQRVADGDPCAFCAMIASQGIVYKDEASGDFQAHDHCGCTAEPAYEGSKVSATNAALREKWDAATSGLKGADALNAFRRASAGATN